MPRHSQAYNAGANSASSDLGLPLIKQAIHPATFGATAVGSVGLGLYLGLSDKQKKKIKSEVHDPRLYSNLRGMLTLESAKERIDAHKKLPKHKDMSVFEAMRSGATRTKDASTP